MALGASLRTKLSWLPITMPRCPARQWDMRNFSILNTLLFLNEILLKKFLTYWYHLTWLSRKNMDFTDREVQNKAAALVICTVTETNTLSHKVAWINWGKISKTYPRADAQEVSSHAGIMSSRHIPRVNKNGL